MVLHVVFQLGQGIVTFNLFLEKHFFTCICVCGCVCACAMHMCMYVWVGACMCVFMCMWVHVFMCLYGCIVCMCVRMCMFPGLRSEDNFQDLVLVFYHVVLGTECRSPVVESSVIIH